MLLKVQLASRAFDRQTICMLIKVWLEGTAFEHSICILLQSTLYTLMGKKKPETKFQTPC